MATKKKNAGSVGTPAPPPPGGNAPQASPQLDGSQVKWLVTALAIVALVVAAWLIFRKEPIPVHPCPVQCIEAALIASNKSTDAKVLEVAAKMVENGSIKLQNNDTLSAEYRAVSDDTIQKAIMACTSSFGGGGSGRAIQGSGIAVDAWSLIHVTQVSASKTIHGVENANVQIGDKNCTTHDGKCTIKLTGVNLSEEVDVQVTTSDNSQVSAKHKVSELIAREITVSVDPPAQRVSVIVSSCDAGQTLGPMSVSLSADAANTWKESCGQAFPPPGQDCRQETLKNGEAKFWVLGKPTRIRVTVFPEAKEPVEYDEGFADPISIKYPSNCTATPPPVPPKDCPALREWVQARLAPGPADASETISVSATPSGLQCRECGNLAPPQNLLGNCKPFSVRRKLAH